MVEDFVRMKRKCKDDNQNSTQKVSNWWFFYTTSIETPAVA